MGKALELIMKRTDTEALMLEWKFWLKVSTLIHGKRRKCHIARGPVKKTVALFGPDPQKKEINSRREISGPANRIYIYISQMSGRECGCTSVSQLPSFFLLLGESPF